MAASGNPSPSAGSHGSLRRKGAGAAAENNERWLLTYADLITLLLAFFIILFAMANTDIQKYFDLQGSLSQAFNVGVLSGQVSSSLSPRTQVNPPEQSDATSPAGADLLAQLEILQQELPGDAVQFVNQRPEGLAISISGAVAFGSGSAELTPQGAKVLTKVMEVIGPLANDLRVEGHTDDLPTGSARYATNWDLSSARAISIVRFLEKAGIPAYRLSAAGYADQRPVALNNSAAGRTLNRRAEIVILKSSITGGPV